MKGEIGPEDLILYVMYVQSLLATVRRIIEFTEQFQKGMTGIERFSEIMSIESDIKDKEDAIEIKSLRGEITFDHVDFSYGEAEEKVLEDFSVHISPGQKLAIVGPSGAGDSDIMMTDTINPLKSKFKGFHKTFKQDDLGLSLSSFLLN